MAKIDKYGLTEGIPWLTATAHPFLYRLTAPYGAWETPTQRTPTTGDKPPYSTPAVPIRIVKGVFRSLMLTTFRLPLHNPMTMLIRALFPLCQGGTDTNICPRLARNNYIARITDYGRVLGGNRSVSPQTPIPATKEQIVSPTGLVCQVVFTVKNRIFFYSICLTLCSFYGTI